MTDDEDVDLLWVLQYVILISAYEVVTELLVLCLQFPNPFWPLEANQSLYSYWVLQLELWSGEEI